MFEDVVYSLRANLFYQIIIVVQNVSSFLIVIYLDNLINMDAMKNMFYIVMLLIFCSIKIYANDNQIIKDKVIKYPFYEYKTPGIFEVPEITISEKDVRIKIKAYVMPNWWIKVDENTFIRDNNNDKSVKYRLVSAEGIEIGKEYPAPKSGIYEYTLVFEPLKYNETSIYLEDGNWKVYAMDVTGYKRFYKKLIPKDYQGEWMTKENDIDKKYTISELYIAEGEDVWEFDSLSKKGKAIEVILKKDQSKKTLLLKKINDNKISIAEKGKNNKIIVEGIE